MGGPGRFHHELVIVEVHLFSASVGGDEVVDDLLAGEHAVSKFRVVKTFDEGFFNAFDNQVFECVITLEV